MNGKNLFSSVVVKFAVCFLLLGISYHLISSTFVQFSPLTISDDDAAELSVADAPPGRAAERPQLIDDLFVNLEHPSKNESCDLFTGDWVPDSDGPFYTNATCKTIEAPQNCMKNGRPDSGYLYWRWKPKNCSLPKLDARRFLGRMRDKSLAFIGDSIMRNQVQSLLCILSQVEEAVEVYHDEPFKNRRWSFPSHRFTVSVVWSPYLSKAFTFEDDDGVSSGITKLHLDEPDTIWTDQYEDFDYVVIAGGKWFLKAAIYYTNQTVWGCHSCMLQLIFSLLNFLPLRPRFPFGSEAVNESSNLNTKTEFYNKQSQFIQQRIF